MSDTTLSYCPNFAETKTRLTTLYERKGLDRVFAMMDTPSEAIQRFSEQYEGGFCAFPDLEERVGFWDTHLYRKLRVLDDGVPVAYLSECDQGLYGGLVGGEVRYLAHPENGWISSMVPPILGDELDLDRLSIDRNSDVFRRYLRQLELFSQAGAGRFGISHFILIDSLNFVYELVGATKTYLLLHDDPDFLRAAIEMAFELNVMVQEAFFAADVVVDGGTFSNIGQWIPGRIVSESLDPFHMTSIDDFERWGREPAERIMNHFDGGVIHIHANGRHLFEAASSLRGLKAIFLGDDLGYPKAFDILPEARQRMGDMPLVVSCDFTSFVEGLETHRLTGGVLYKVSGVPDADTANRYMDRVREYST